MELGNHCEWLDVMKYQEMLAMFFVNDGDTTSKWRLKGHAENTPRDRVGRPVRLFAALVMVSTLEPLPTIALLLTGTSGILAIPTPSEKRHPHRNLCTE